MPRLSCPACGKQIDKYIFHKHWEHSANHAHPGNLPLPDWTGLERNEILGRGRVPEPHPEDPVPFGLEQGEPDPEPQVFENAGLPSESGRPYIHPREPERQLLQDLQQHTPYAPFDSFMHYCLAWDLSTPQMHSNGDIKKFGVKRGRSVYEDEIKFASARSFFRCLDILAECQCPWTKINIIFDGSAGGITFWKRDALAVVQEILENAGIADKCVFAPVREYNTEGQRVYTSMHTANWWWDVQVLNHY
jgi:Plavaka transposase